MTMGPTRVAPALISMAPTATARWPRSGATSGAKRLMPALSVRFVPNGLAVSSLYFIDVGAPLGIVDLHVFWRGFHQLGMGAGGEHLAFHQENDLVVVFYRSNLLGNRDQGDAGVLLVDVAQDGALGVG